MILDSLHLKRPFITYEAFLSYEALWATGKKLSLKYGFLMTKQRKLVQTELNFGQNLCSYDPR